MPTWLGDAVMASPAIENLLEEFSDADVYAVGSTTSIGVLKNHPRILNSYVLSKDYRSLFRVSKMIGKVDFFFSFRDTFRSYFFKLILSSKYKYSYSKKMNANLHQVEKYNQFINESLNSNKKSDKLLIYNENYKKFRKNRPILGINPGAKYGNAKQWYPQEFAKVAAKLSDRFDIIIFGSKSEIDVAKDIEEILVNDDISNYENLAGKTNISELVNYISNLDLFITGDSGPMHIAASFQIPTVSIFGPTNDIETSQWMNEKSMIVKKNLECQPCMKRTCPLNHHNCMKMVVASDVLRAVKTFN